MSELRTPAVGSIRNPLPETQSSGVWVWFGDCTDPNEPMALVIPQTQEARDILYHRLVAAFSGRADRFDLAHTALAAIGVTIERKADAA